MIKNSCKMGQSQLSVSDGDLKFRGTTELGNLLISYVSQIIPEKCTSAIFLEKSKHNNSRIPVKPSTVIFSLPFLPDIKKYAVRVDTTLQNPFLLKKAYRNCY